MLTPAEEMRAKDLAARLGDQTARTLAYIVDEWSAGRMAAPGLTIGWANAANRLLNVLAITTNRTADGYRYAPTPLGERIHALRIAATSGRGA